MVLKRHAGKTVKQELVITELGKLLKVDMGRTGKERMLHNHLTDVWGVMKCVLNGEDMFSCPRSCRPCNGYCTSTAWFRRF